MTNLDNTEVHSRTMTAFFDTKEAASTAVRDLENAGIPREHINLVEGSTSSSSTTASDGEKGFWESLKDFFMPDEDRYAYAEGLRRGGYLVSVRSDEANYNRVMDILDTDGAVNLDEREAAWRSEGWPGYQAGGLTGVPGAGVETADYRAASTTGTQRDAPTSTSAGRPSDVRGLQAGQDEVIPVYEEQLRIGKRDVSHGRVRLRTYVMESPVTEQVALRSEHVEIERHPVDRAVSATDAAFQDRTIEAEEYAEEAVVQKDVRVKEEIGLRKVAEERTQTVSDKVRRTEVEVEDERGTVNRGADSTTAPPEPPRTPKV